MTYFILGIFFSYLAFTEIFLKSFHNSKLSLWIVFLILVLVTSLRYQVGHDWDSYLLFYTDNTTAEVLELGYRFLNNFFSSLSINYNLFLFFISAFTLFFIYKAVIELKYKIIALFVYFSELFLYFNLSGVRQGVAIAITLFSARYIINKDFKKFTFFVIFASLFHISSLIFFLAYFAFHVKINRNRLAYFIFIFGIIWVNINQIVDFIIFYSNSRTLEYYTYIIKPQEDNNIFYIVGLLKRSIILLIFYTLPKRLRAEYNLASFINIYILGFLIYLFIYPLSENIGTRAAAYFLIFDIIIIAIFFQLKIHVYRKLSIFFIVFMMYMYKIYGYSQLVDYDYKFIF